MRDQLAETKERYREASGGVTERTRELAEVSTIILLQSCKIQKITYL